VGISNLMNFRFRESYPLDFNGSPFCLGVYDVVQKNILFLEFPIVGHFKVSLESISPEFNNISFEAIPMADLSGRNLRSLVYRRAKMSMNTHHLGTQRDLNGIDYMAATPFIYAIGA